MATKKTAKKSGKKSTTKKSATKKTATKYSAGAGKSVKSAMKKMEAGTLKSGRSGRKVTNPKQAIAIGLSEAREKGARVPKKKA